jgi:hypothetical protein
MKHVLLKLAGASLLALTLGTVSQADTITAIMGTGIPDDGWVANVTYPATGSTQNGVQVALRARNEWGGTLTQTGFDYYVNTGTLDASHALWNLDFSINSDLDGSANGLNNLTAYTYKLTFEGHGSIDPLAYFSDNSYGNNSTGQGAGVEDNNPSAHNIAQNSENALFPWPGINPNVPGTYVFTLEAFQLDPNAVPNPYARTQIAIHVSAVPDGGMTAVLLGLGLVGMSFVGRRRKQVKA